MKLSTSNTGFPKPLIGVVIGICILPSFLNLLGVDFGTSRVPFDAHNAITMSKGEMVESIFITLKGSYVHTILEWSAFCAAIFTVFLAFSHFRITGDIVTPIIGMALFFAGGMDAFHTLAADRLIQAVANNRDLIPFTWAICRLFNGLIVVGVVLGLLTRKEIKEKQVMHQGIGVILGISLFLGVIAYVIIHLCATTSNLPKTMFSDKMITRPWDIYPLVVFIVSGLFVFPKFYKKYPSVFSYSLIIAIIPNIATQLHMAFGSADLFDNHFNIAHFLKIISYFVPLAGLLIDYVRTYQKAEKTAEELVCQKGDLEKANAELKSLDEMKSNFLSTISHELRTPLTSILGYNRLIVQQYETMPNKDKLEFMNITINQGEHLLRLVNDILDVAKAESGHLKIERAEVDITPIIVGAIEQVRILADKKQISIKQEISSLETIIFADQHRINQVLINLLSNAIKFTQKGGKILINVENYVHSEKVLLVSINDNGDGIPNDKLKVLFNRFVQIDNSPTRKAGGTGLGLAIVKEFIQLHGGRIWAESEEGNGSTFFFTILKADKREEN